MFDYYDVLGVDTHATQDQIQHVYRALIKQHHPDVNPNSTDARFCELINEAYAVLKDPQQRSMYDAKRFKHTSAVEEALCDWCRKNDVHLRVVKFYQVRAFFCYFRSRLIQGTFCQDCRSTLAWQTASTSLLFGLGALKGIPLCFKAMYYACLGGRALREETALLLKSQCAWYLQQGDIDAAFSNLTYSLEYEDDDNDETDALLQSSVYDSAQLLAVPWIVPGQGLAITSLVVVGILMAWCFFYPLQVWGGTMTPHWQRALADDTMQRIEHVPANARKDLVLHSTDGGHHWQPISFGDASLYKIVSIKRGLVGVVNYDGSSEVLKQNELVAHGLTASAKSGTWFYLQTTDQGETRIKTHAIFHDPHKAYPLVRSRNGGKTWEFIPVNTGALYKIVGVKQGYVQTSVFSSGAEFWFLRDEMEMHGIRVGHDIGKWYYIGIDSSGRAELETQSEYLEIQSQCENHICTD